MALIYDTRGKDSRAPPLMVVVVRTVSNPSDTLAGEASMLIQKETQERMTINILGTYTCIMKNPISLRSTKVIDRHGNEPRQHNIGLVIWRFNT